jgi:hypothetical protein
MTEQGEWLRGMHGLRGQLLDGLTDADLGFSLPGNPTLGEMFREEAEIERSYADSFKSFTQTFEQGKSDPALATRLDQLKAHYQALDADLDGTLEALSEADIERNIERGSSLSVRSQLQVYFQAVLIFFGKATIYYRAMGKPLPENWKEWIG